MVSLFPSKVRVPPAEPAVVTGLGRSFAPFSVTLKTTRLATRKNAEGPEAGVCALVLVKVTRSTHSALVKALLASTVYGGRPPAQRPTILPLSRLPDVKTGTAELAGATAPSL